jgi:hypothetical protein
MSKANIRYISFYLQPFPCDSMQVPHILIIYSGQPRYRPIQQGTIVYADEPETPENPEESCAEMYISSATPKLLIVELKDMPTTRSCGFRIRGTRRTVLPNHSTGTCACCRRVACHRRRLIAPNALVMGKSNPIFVYWTRSRRSTARGP